MNFKFETLEKSHNRKAFSCGEALLDRYFYEQVTQDIKRRVTSCFVAVQDDVIAGFYTLASASIPMIELPEDLARRLPRYPVLPAIRIGRLAVDLEFQKQGVGSMLLIDAMHRALRAEAANYSVLVDAKNELAVAFYKHHGFISFASKKNVLFLPLATAKNLLQRR